MEKNQKEILFKTAVEMHDGTATPREEIRDRLIREAAARFGNFNLTRAYALVAEMNGDEEPDE